METQNETITISRSQFEHILNCLANQKYVNGFPEGIKEETQQIIDRAWDEGMMVLHGISRQDMDAINAALQEPDEPFWKIQGKHSNESEWIPLGGGRTEEMARHTFEGMRSDFSGGFYQLLNPDGVVVDEFEGGN